MDATQSNGIDDSDDEVIVLDVTQIVSVVGMQSKLKFYRLVTTFNKSIELQGLHVEG